MDKILVHLLEFGHHRVVCPAIALTVLAFLEQQTLDPKKCVCLATDDCNGLMVLTVAGAVVGAGAGGLMVLTVDGAVVGAGAGGLMVLTVAGAVVGEGAGGLTVLTVAGAVVGAGAGGLTVLTVAGAVVGAGAGGLTVLTVDGAVVGAGAGGLTVLTVDGAVVSVSCVFRCHVWFNTNLIIYLFEVTFRTGLRSRHNIALDNELYGNETL